MRLEHYPAERLKKEILSVIGRRLNLQDYHVFFFGSRVSGGGDERSDIDIGIEGPGEIPGETVSAIREEIEGLPLLYKIDVVDFSNVSSDFREVALQEMEQISV